MWDDTKGHHTEMQIHRGKTVYVVTGPSGSILRTLYPKSNAENNFYLDRLNAGECIICDDLENAYAVQC